MKYTSVSCTLTLHKHTTRIKRDLSADSLTETFGAVQSIATSSAQNDSGIFDLNFRDERYLPFEGAGAISYWYLELPTEFRQFDYNTISDIIFHISYTARDGGGTFKTAVNKELEGALKKMELGDDRTGLMQVFSAKHEFSGEWHRFFQLMKEENEQDYKHKLELGFSKDRFPYQFRHETITVTNMTLFVKLKGLSKGKTYDIQSIVYDLKRTDKDVNDATKKFIKCKTPNGEELEFLLCSKPIDKKSIKLTKKENWSFEVKETAIPLPLQSKVKIDGVTHNRLNPDAVEDMFLVFQYYIEE